MTLLLNAKLVAFTFQPEFFGLFIEILSNGKSWIILIIGTLIGLIPDFLYSNIKFMYFPSMSEKVLKYVENKKVSPSFRIKL